MTKTEVFGVVCCLFFCLSVTGHAQSSQIVDEILEEEAISYGQAAYLVLTAAGIVQDTVSPEQALIQPVVPSWKLETKSAADPVRLGEYCFMMMKTFELQGGLLYRIFPGPRYASRELAYNGYIKGSRDPGRHVPGEEALRLLAHVLERKEESE